MKLLAIEQWRITRFAEPRPSKKTVNNWCNRGDIPAQRRGNLWFVDIDEEENMTGNELVDSVLKAS